jgi:hypothetical protein
MKQAFSTIMHIGMDSAAFSAAKHIHTHMVGGRDNEFSGSP